MKTSWPFGSSWRICQGNCMSYFKLMKEKPQECESCGTRSPWRRRIEVIFKKICWRLRLEIPFAFTISNKKRSHSYGKARYSWMRPKWAEIHYTFSLPGMQKLASQCVYEIIDVTIWKWIDISWSHVCQWGWIWPQIRVTKKGRKVWSGYLAIVVEVNAGKRGINFLSPIYEIWK